MSTVTPLPHERAGAPLYAMVTGSDSGHAREVAAVVAMLTTPAAGYVTGASYVVDGGMLLMAPQASQLLTDDGWRTP